MPRHSKKSQLKEHITQNANIKNLTDLPHKSAVRDEINDLGISREQLSKTTCNFTV
jgi:uncharacterized protein YjiS (DUF1127 family)